MTEKIVKIDIQRLDWIKGEPMSVFYKEFEFGEKHGDTNEFRMTVKSPKGQMSILIDGNGTIKLTTEMPDRYD